MGRIISPGDIGNAWHGLIAIIVMRFLPLYPSLSFILLATKFGAMLDQLTDRCGTCGLLVTLSYFYPKYMFWFQLSMAIDVACHWFYLHT